MRRAAVILSAFLGFSPIPIAQLAFEGPRTTLTGPATAGLAAADFDEDGRADLVLALTDADAAMVLIASENAGFRALAVPAGARPEDVAAADLDGDGHADFVTVDRADGTASLRSGDGSGAFAERRPFAAGAEPVRAAVADLDGDGAPDLLIARVGRVDRLRNDGGGGFLAPEGAVRTAGNWISSVDTADLNADGIVDLALVVKIRIPIFGVDLCSIDTFLGDGTGGFADPSPLVDYLPPLGNTSIVARDADADGIADIVVAGNSLGALVFRGDGSGVFGRTFLEIRSGGAATSVAAADADHDGRVEIFCANYGPELGLAVVASNDAGRFEHATYGSTSRTPRRLVVADFDGDLHADVALVVGNGDRSSPDAVDVFFNRSPTLLRVGTVNAGAGSIADVLYVNDSVGGVGRRLRVGQHEPLVVFLAPPPAAGGPVDYAMYGWIGEPVSGSARALPFGVGSLCRGDAPRVIWNTTGRRSLGKPTAESDRAPAILARRASGLGRQGLFVLQGVIRDPGSAASRPASVTNGVILDVR